MVQNKIKGVGVALITPFNNFEVDYPALERMVEHVIAGGVDYIVALGSTAETATLSLKERQQVYDFIMAGSEAAGAASGIMNAEDPLAMIDEMIAATRRAADDLKKQGK